MIVINILDNGFEISGHAEAAKPGKDLVCAAVSAISQGIVNCFPRKDIDILEISQDPAFIKFKLKKVDERSKVVLEVFLNQIQTVRSSNKKYIKIIK